MAQAPTSNDKHRCAGITGGGQPCRARPRPGSTWCFTHDPEMAGERDAARSKGGQNRANVVRLGGLVPPRLLGVFDRLERAMDEVHAGTIDPKVAGAMASLAGAMTRVLTTGEVEAKLREIEAQLARQAAGQEPAA